LNDPQYLQVSRLLLGELHHKERVCSFVNEAFVTKANVYLEELVQENLNTATTNPSASRILVGSNPFVRHRNKAKTPVLDREYC